MELMRPLSLGRPSGRRGPRQVIRLNVVETVRKQILLELRTLYQSQSPHIVKFYGAFFTEGQIQICLELMDGRGRGRPARPGVWPWLTGAVRMRRCRAPSGGSLEGLVARIGAFPEPIVGRIAGQVLRGLVYLHKDRHLLHRDLKPSNILINARGEVKISDFGVSGQLASSLASRGTWVGTVTYFSVRGWDGAGLGAVFTTLTAIRVRWLCLLAPPPLCSRSGSKASRTRSPRTSGPLA